ncbi:MAG: hypothetical protein KBS81_04940 [Spirochaetales bacterium]|nr:hypothetical protein [Candidatus Physcosoma equi]
MRKWILLALVLLFALTSCTTIRPNILPSWVNTKPVLSGYVTHVGEGSGETASEARNAAYRDVLSKMGGEIGYDLYDLYYREFSANKTIGAIGTKVNDEYSYTSNGIYFHFVYASTAEGSFYAARRAEYVALLDREARIQRLLDAAVEEYRQNRDVGAAETVLRALLVSLEGDTLNESYQPEALVGKAVEYLERIRIRNVKNKRRISPDAISFRVVRNKGLVKPVVEEAIVVCEYRAIKNDYSLGSTSTMGRTDRYGRFVFNWTNPFAMRSGELKISVKLDADLLYRITLAGGTELLEPVRKVLEDTSFVYAYSRETLLEPSSVVIAVAEYGFDGRAKEETYLESSLKNAFLMVDAAVPEIVTVLEDEGSEIEEDLLARFGEKDLIIVCRTGVSDHTQAAGRNFAKAEGQMVLLFPKEGMREEYSNIHFASGGESEVEADEATLRTIAEITASLVLEEF